MNQQALAQPADCCMLNLDVMLLQIETKRIAPDITLLELVGKISLGRESQRIETLVQDLLRQNERKIIFDVSRVDHMDSTGIGVLAYCFGTLNRCGGELRVAGASGKVLHLLQITHLDHVLPLVSSVEAACVSLGAKPPA
jgi:anti-sigma B factor antagonist